MVLDGDTRRLDGVDETTNNDGTSALDVVVEHAVCVLVALEGGEGVLEVLELDNDAVTRSVTAFGNRSVVLTWATCRSGQP